MRSLTEISTQIKAAFVSNSIIAEAYALTPGQTFDEQFSAVSFEGAVIAVIAFSHFLIESIIDSFRTEIDDRIENAYLCSIPWFYTKALEFQLGYSLQFDATTYRFTYSEVDEAAKIVKYAAIRQVEDTITKLQVYTNKNGKVPLTTSEHNAFKAYMATIGPAGIHYEFINLAPDQLQITLQVIFNPLILNDSGQKHTDSSYPVREAIQNYVDGITFGGTLNRTRLIDAIQAADGVEDVILTEIQHAPDGEAFEIVTGQNIESTSGSFVIDTITDTYTPNV